jgi:hypothetical protein
MNTLLLSLLIFNVLIIINTLPTTRKPNESILFYFIIFNKILIFIIIYL